MAANRYQITTTFRCCGYDLTMNTDYEQGSQFACPICGKFLFGKKKGGFEQYGYDWEFDTPSQEEP